MRTGRIPYATISGGLDNVASGEYSTVAGGRANYADGHRGTVGGGYNNHASGIYSTIPGGSNNTAGGDQSFVVGVSGDDGDFDNVFVWDDGSGSDATQAYTFNVNANFAINLNSPTVYFNGGGVHFSSDRNLKKDFSEIDPEAVLEKVVNLPITTWRFKREDDSVEHIGPVAQDFAETFGYGVDEKHITATDADGVALAAIQGLYALVEDLQAQVDHLESLLKESGAK